jgi:hypothetical protein
MEVMFLKTELDYAYEFLENSDNLNDVWSFDGKLWSLIAARCAWSGRDGHTALVFDNTCFLLGGTDDPYFCRNGLLINDLININNFFQTCGNLMMVLTGHV